MQDTLGDGGSVARATELCQEAAHYSSLLPGAAAVTQAGADTELVAKCFFPLLQYQSAVRCGSRPQPLLQFDRWTAFREGLLEER